ncbi:MAG: diadenylate cyclase [Planctomycetota bacterium]
MLKGIVVLLITFYLAVRILGGVFDTARLGILFQQFLFYASFAAIVVFQPELRRALMRLGETRLLRAATGGTDEIASVVDACTTLSRRRIGALLAFERDEGLAGFAEDATRIDAEVSAQLLTTIFYPNTSLHDLGVVIRDARIAYAGVQFPLAESGELTERELGSRHRAAVGLSMNVDAVVVVVSEETGDISVAEGGRLHRRLSPERLLEMLHELLNRSVPLAQSDRPSTITASDRETSSAATRLDSLSTKRPTSNAMKRPATLPPAKPQTLNLKAPRPHKPTTPSVAPADIRETKPVGKPDEAPRKKAG